MQTIITTILLVNAIIAAFFIFKYLRNRKAVKIDPLTIQKGAIVYFIDEGEMVAGRVTINRRENKKLYVQILGQHAKWDFVPYKKVIEVI